MKPNVTLPWTKEALAARIDHTLLRPDARLDEISALCREAMTYGFASVCVNPCYVALCRERLRGSGVAVCTVAGFPLGASETHVKAFEARRAVEDGAREIDMVLNLGALKSLDLDTVYNDIAAVVRAAAPADVKVIIETCLLFEEEKRAACALIAEAGAAFVKTSTGFLGAGATAEDVRLLKQAGSGLRVKAAGGIRTTAAALALLEAGADRLGCSASVEVVEGLVSASAAGSAR